MTHLNCCKAVNAEVYAVLKQKQDECKKLELDLEDGFSISKIRAKGLSEEQDTALRQLVLAQDTFNDIQEYWQRCKSYGVLRLDLKTKGKPWEGAWYNYLESTMGRGGFANDLCKHCNWIPFYKSVGKLPCTHRCPFAFNGVPISEKRVAMMTTYLEDRGILPYFDSFVDIFGTVVYTYPTWEKAPDWDDQSD